MLATEGFCFESVIQNINKNEPLLDKNRIKFLEAYIASITAYRQSFCSHFHYRSSLPPILSTIDLITRLPIDCDDKISAMIYAYFCGRVMEEFNDHWHCHTGVFILDDQLSLKNLKIHGFLGDALSNQIDTDVFLTCDPIGEHLNRIFISSNTGSNSGEHPLSEKRASDYH